MVDEQAVEERQIAPIEMHEMPPDDQPVDSNRYTTVSDRPSPTKVKQPTSMYAAEPRHQPMTSKTSPRVMEPNLYYIDSIPIDEQPNKKRNRQSRFSPGEGTQSNVSTVFLEPKVMPQPVLYTIANTKSTPIPDPSMSSDHQPFMPTIYSLTSRPRPQTVDMSANSFELPASQINNKSPTLYSLTSNYTPQKAIHEPTEQHLRPSPSFYSIIGSPARTSRGTQVDLPDPNGPAPILYTIVGDTPPEKNRSKENNPPAKLRRSSTDVAMYPLTNEPRPQQTGLTNQTPTLYALVGQPDASTKPQTKQPPIKQVPPAIFVTDRTNRSIERKPELFHEETVTYPIRKTGQDSPSKDRKYPKAEGLIIPMNDEPSRARLPASSEQIQRKPNPPIQLPDYRSPYAFRTQKPYRGRKFNADPLPVVSNSRSETKSRQPLYETGSHLDRRQPSAAPKPKSLERYPVNKDVRSRLWDNGYQSQTDDDEEYEQRTYRKRRTYKNAQPRAPWIPVW